MHVYIDKPMDILRYFAQVKVTRHSFQLLLYESRTISKWCAGKEGTTTTVGWSFLWVIFFGLVFAGVGAYAVYKYRLRVKQLPISQFPLYPLIFICKWSHVGLDLLVVTVIMIHLLLKSLSSFPQSYMDSEIRAIMAQCMPLDNQEGANQHQVVHANDIWSGTPFLEQHRGSAQHFTYAAGSLDMGFTNRSTRLKDTRVVRGDQDLLYHVLTERLCAPLVTTLDEQHRGWYHRSFSSPSLPLVLFKLVSSCCLAAYLFFLDNGTRRMHVNTVNTVTWIKLQPARLQAVYQCSQALVLRTCLYMWLMTDYFRCFCPILSNQNYLCNYGKHGLCMNCKLRHLCEILPALR